MQALFIVPGLHGLVALAWTKLLTLVNSWRIMFIGIAPNSRGDIGRVREVWLMGVDVLKLL